MENNTRRLITQVSKWRQEDALYWLDRGHDEATACALANIAIRFRENSRGEITQKERTSFADFTYEG